MRKKRDLLQEKEKNKNIDKDRIKRVREDYNVVLINIKINYKEVFLILNFF